MDDNIFEIYDKINVLFNDKNIYENVSLILLDIKNIKCYIYSSQYGLIRELYIPPEYNTSVETYKKYIIKSGYRLRYNLLNNDELELEEVDKSRSSSYNKLRPLLTKYKNINPFISYKIDALLKKI